MREWLQRKQEDIGGTTEVKRRLLNSVVHSKILYGAEIWRAATETVVVRRRLAGVQRHSVLRVISGYYKTVSESAALILASTPSINFLVREREESYSEAKEIRDNIWKAEIKRAARRKVFAKWQERWDVSTTGRWTYTLIPNLEEWCNRKHGDMDYYLTQALTSHECFNEYLDRFKKRANASLVVGDSR